MLAEDAERVRGPRDSTARPGGRLEEKRAPPMQEAPVSRASVRRALQASRARASLVVVKAGEPGAAGMVRCEVAGGGDSAARAGDDGDGNEGGLLEIREKLWRGVGGTVVDKDELAGDAALCEGGELRDERGERLAEEVGAAAGRDDDADFRLEVVHLGLRKERSAGCLRVQPSVWG